MRKRIAAALFALAVVAGLVAIAQGPAAATSGSLPGCSSGYVCLYEHIDGGGIRVNYANINTCVYVGSVMDNKMSSWQNNTTVKAKVYTNANCTGFTDTLLPGLHRHSMSSCCLMNDVISALWIGNNYP